MRFEFTGKFDHHMLYSYYFVVLFFKSKRRSVVFNINNQKVVDSASGEAGGKVLGEEGGYTNSPKRPRGEPDIPGNSKLVL